MKLDDMKNDIPETPEFIHQMILDEVEKQLKVTNIENTKSSTTRKWSKSRFVAAAAACLLVASTTAYAGTTLYKMYLEKQGAYSISTRIKSGDGNELLTIPGEVHDISYQADYIPDGYEWKDNLHLSLSGDELSGFSFNQVLLDKNGIGTIQENIYVEETEQRTFGKYEGVYLRYNALADQTYYNQLIYLLCPEQYRIVTISISDNISKEEAIKVAENLTIVEENKMIDTTHMPTWSELAKTIASPIHHDSQYLNLTAKEQNVTIYRTGDSIKYNASVENKDGKWITSDNISVKVDSVQTSDDLHLLDTAKLPNNWDDVLDENGKLKQNTLTYVKSGDGKNSLDSIVKTENVNQKLLFATLTFTNNSENPLNHIPYLASLMFVDTKGGNYIIQNPKEKSGDGYDRILWNGIAANGSMDYYSTKESYGNGGNYISLQPGESTQVNVAWIVNEQDLSHAYLSFEGEIEFTSNHPSLVDIRQ